MKIILASTSPRRKELLKKAGFKFKAVASNYKENMSLKLKPKELAKLLALEKALAVAKNQSDAIVIGADTFIAFRNEILGKPHTAERAKEMLWKLSGRTHSVITGFAVVNTKNNKIVNNAREAKITFKKLNEKTINDYVKTGEPLDKAGAYAIQRRGKKLIKSWSGDYDTIVGLPVKDIAEILRKFKTSENFPLKDIFRFKAKLKRAGIKGLGVDIDETLAYTNGHWVSQMLLKFGNPEKLTGKEMIKKYVYMERVPYFQTKAASKMMDKFMHSNKFQETIPLIENSNHTLNKINKIVPIAAYITARPETVRRGTEKWLSKHGFPKAPVILKPKKVPFEEKNVWKAKALETLYPEIIGIIDDNPGLAGSLAGHYQGIVFLYDSDYHARKNIKIVPCRTWDKVYEKIKKYKF